MQPGRSHADHHGAIHSIGRVPQQSSSPSTFATETYPQPQQQQQQ